MWNFLQIMKLDYVTSRTHKRKISRVASSVQYANHILLLFNVHSNGGRVMLPHLAFEHFVPGKRIQKRRDMTRPRRVLAALFAAVTALYSQDLLADEGGVSFWLPGFFGSLAAAPQQPGWSLTSIYYHTSVSAGADVARAREFEIGRIPITATANVSASLQARADLGLLMPTYTFATPVLGGQLTVGAIGLYGRAD